MARPPQANADETRHRVLSAAKALFAASGPDGTSMRDVARKADVSQATVHHYFGSKADLHRAVIDAMYVELSTLSEALIKVTREETARGRTDFPAIMSRIVSTCFRFCLDHLSAIRMTTRESIEGSTRYDAEQRRALLPFLEAATEWLAPHVECSNTELRLRVRTVSLLIVRYALVSPPEMQQVIAPDEPEANAHAPETIETIETHLTKVACALLVMP